MPGRASSKTGTISTTCNSVVVYDADGSYLGKYRKTHIPDSPQYHEKFYFTPGDLGYPVFKTKFGVIAVGICWDEWFPEVARIFALKGAEVLFYPSAIGSEPDRHNYCQSTDDAPCVGTGTNVIVSARSNHPGGAQAALADGSVRFLAESTDSGTLRSLITRDGGEAVQGNF